MAKINIRSVVEVSHPDIYNVDRLCWMHLYCKVLKLSEAKELCRYLKMDNKPYVIVTMAGTLDDDVRWGKEKMRLFCIFSPVKGK